MAWCVILRPLTVPGRISMARTQRGSVRPDSTTGFHQVSLRVRLLGPRRGLDDQVRLGLAEHAGEVPALLGRPLHRRRHVLHVALRRTGVNPLDDGLDLLVAEATVVLEVLDADRLVDVPWRHLASLDPAPDGARPRPSFLVGHEGHRRNRIGPMTGLALLLENRRDILREGGRVLRRGRSHRTSPEDQCCNSEGTPCPAHVEAPSFTYPEHLLAFSWTAKIPKLTKRAYPARNKTFTRQKLALYGA